MVEDIDLSVCCVKGCEKPSLALGLCVNHWRRNRKYGSPVAIKTRAGQMRGLSAERRFALQMQKSPRCWTWAGSRDRDGYGIFRATFDGVQYTKAHRYSYAAHTGEHPGELHVCHRCDDPRCVNPEHLFLGTNADNMADKIAKGRARGAPGGEQSPHAILTEAQAKAILSDARPYTAIAADYGVSPGTVASLKQRKSWKGIDAEAVKAPRISPRKGKSDKITPEIVREIRSSPEQGKTLAERFGVSRQLITDIRKGRAWAHVT